MRQKKILFTAACILAAVGAMAQGNGQAGITEKTFDVWKISWCRNDENVPNAKVDECP